MNTYMYTSILDAYIQNSKEALQQGFEPKTPKHIGDVCRLAISQASVIRVSSARRFPNTGHLCSMPEPRQTLRRSPCESKEPCQPQPQSPNSRASTADILLTVEEGGTGTKPRAEQQWRSRGGQADVFCRAGAARTKRTCHLVVPRGRSRTQSVQARCNRSRRKTCLPKGLEEQDFRTEFCCSSCWGTDAPEHAHEKTRPGATARRPAAGGRGVAWRCLVPG